MVEQRRNIKGSEDEILKKIAKADNVNKGREKAMGTFGRLQDREYVKNVRDPAKFNAMTYVKEYNKRLDVDN